MSLQWCKLSLALSWLITVCKDLNPLCDIINWMTHFQEQNIKDSDIRHSCLFTQPRLLENICWSNMPSLKSLENVQAASKEPFIGSSSGGPEPLSRTLQIQVAKIVTAHAASVGDTLLGVPLLCSAGQSSRLLLYLCSTRRRGGGGGVK